jgi:hypothetical protein
MNTSPTPALSATQQSMLDLALACDLKSTETARHDAIRKRHQAIKNQQDAADYIREVENRIHSRRSFTPPTRKTQTTLSLTKFPEEVKTITGTQTSFAILFLLAFMIAMGWFAPAGLNLALVTLSMLLMMIVLGISTTGRPLGILINERNLISLSRFQTVVWTIIILSAYLTFALVRIKMMAEGKAISDPLGIQIDWQLWALLGISTTSLVGTPLILSTKKDKEPIPTATQKAAQTTNEPEQEIVANKQGILYANSKISDARLTDMFEGDELANTARIDLAKVQMFFFTIIAAVCLFVMVFKLLTTDNSDLGHLPSLPEGFVAILGISHAGYLTSKGVSRTQTQT